MNQPELAHPDRAARPRRVARIADSVEPTRVTIAWSPANHDAAFGLVPTELERVAELEAAPNRTWICPEGLGPNWLEALCSARCREVVLTAHVGNDFRAQHLVLGLAELLTFKLSESQPLIRVLFRPTNSAPRRSRRHA